MIVLRRFIINFYVETTKEKLNFHYNLKKKNYIGLQNLPEIPPNAQIIKPLMLQNDKINKFNTFYLSSYLQWILMLVFMYR